MSESTIDHDALACLSERERLVARKAAEGLTYRQIAEELFIAPGTVRTHLATAYRKLGVHNKAELIRLIYPPTPETAQLTESNIAVSSDLPKQGVWWKASHYSLMVIVGFLVALFVTAGAVWWSSQLEEPALPLPDRPSLVVLPFIDLSHPAENDFFADAVTEDIITKLARFNDLFVISSNSSFRYKNQVVATKQVGRELGVRYALEGSVRRAGEQLRVTAQLIDTVTDEHLWTETYDRVLNADNLFTVQDEIASQVAGVLGGYNGKLAAATSSTVLEKPTDNLQAYELYVLGTYMKNEVYSQEALVKIEGYFHQALEKDPSFGLHYVGLGWMEMRAVWGGWSPDPQASLQKASEYGQKARQLDRTNNALIPLLLGDVYATMGDIQRGVSEHQKALARNPNDAMIQNEAAAFLAYAGRVDEALELLHNSMRLNPFYPDTYLWNAAIINYPARQYQAVIDAVDRPYNLMPPSKTQR